MVSKELETLKKWLDTLSPEEREGAIEALQAIQAARMGGGGGGFVPPEIEIDPDLEQPETEGSDELDPDTEIDDPDKILKGKDDSEKESDDSKDDGDSESEAESKDGKEHDPTKKKGEHKPSSGKGDTDKLDDMTSQDSGDKGDNPDLDPSHPDKAKSDDSKDTDDLIDDTDDGLPTDLVDDAETAAAKKHEVFRRKVELTTGRKQIKRALKRIEDGKAVVSKEDEETLRSLDEQLSELLDKLNEHPESVEDMSAEDFNALIKKVLDTVDKTGIVHKEITDVDARIKKIEDEFNDGLSSEELDDEDAANRSKDPEYKKMKAREAEKERLRKELEASKSELEASKSAGFNGNIETFKADLKKAVGDQIQDMIEVEEETYAIVNRHHEDDDMAVPGVRIDEIPDTKKPSIEIYFDQSGSWGSSEVERGMKAIQDILKLEKEGYLTINIYYFSQILSQDQEAARREYRQECWDLVIDNINAAPKAKNVIIMTDRDIGYDYGYAGHRGCRNGKGTVVDGCVWYLWKGGRRVPEARLKLKGRKGTFEYTV